MAINPILSICIPTFNRACYLEKTLESIVSQPVFQNTNEVEIVISDNCSEDNTKDMVQKFIDKYQDKIRYFCNEENIKDKNFEMALSRGRGDFLKLNNDTLIFLPNGLENMVAFIKENKQEKPVLFFLNDTLKTKQNITHCNSLDEFLLCISFQIGWIGGFGIWKEDFDSLEDFSREAVHQFAQTDVLCRLCSEKNKSVLVNNIPVARVADVKNKKANSPAKVFGYFFPLVLKRFVDDKKLSEKVYEQTVKKMFTNILVFSQFNFTQKVERKNYWEYTKDFHDKLYFYTAYIKIPFIILMTAIPNKLFFAVPKKIRQLVYRCFC